jgi:hypothetical protein
MKTEEDLGRELGLFDKLSDHCLICAQPFDKKNREMVMIWHVVVLGQERVNLYCPECWDNSLKLSKLQFEEEE